MNRNIYFERCSIQKYYDITYSDSSIYYPTVVYVQCTYEKECSYKKDDICTVHGSCIFKSYVRKEKN